MEYYIYENWHRKRGAIHLSNCSYCNDGGGTQAADSGQNGKWRGPFSRENAFRSAKKMTNVEPCKVCNPVPPD
jgi:hypothetical protein